MAADGTLRNYPLPETYDAERPASWGGVIAPYVGRFFDNASAISEASESAYRSGQRLLDATVLIGPDGAIQTGWPERAFSNRVEEVPVGQYFYELQRTREDRERGGTAVRLGDHPKPATDGHLKTGH